MSVSFPPAVQSSHFPFTVTETICAQPGDEKPETGAFQAQLISGQISRNVSTEHPLIWLIFQTFDEGEKRIPEGYSNAAARRRRLWFAAFNVRGGGPGGGEGGSIFAWQRSSAYLRYVCLKKKKKRKKTGSGELETGNGIKMCSGLGLTWWWWWWGGVGGGVILQQGHMCVSRAAAGRARLPCLAGVYGLGVSLGSQRALTGC